MESSIPPLYRYSISKLPLDTFIDLSSSIPDAQQLQYAIVHKLKTFTSTTGSAGISTSAVRDGFNPINDDHGAILQRGRVLQEEIYNRTTVAHHPSEYDKQAKTRTNQAIGITTVAALLLLSPYAIFHRLDPILTVNECARLYQRICIHCSPTVKTAYSLFSLSTSPQENLPSKVKGNYRYLSTGWHTLNNKLHGGIRIGAITELMGCAGTGKTQLALQTTITAVLDHHNDTGIGGGTIWIDTEQKVSLVRLQEMTIERCGLNHHPNQVDDVLENVTVHSPSNINELIHVLDSLETEINQRKNKSVSNTNHSSANRNLPVRLIVIDSIAAPARREYKWSAAQQAICLMQMAQLLKRYADQYSIAILIINQITSSSTSVNNNNRSHPMNDTTGTTSTRQQQRAALGTAWHHCVTTRLELQQDQSFDHDNYNGNTATTSSNTKKSLLRRHVKIVKSLTIEPSYEPIPFQITMHGIVDIPEG